MGYNVKKAETNLDLEKGIISQITLSIEKGEKKQEKGITINKIEIRKCKRRKYLNRGGSKNNKTKDKGWLWSRIWKYYHKFKISGGKLYV